MKTEKYQCDVCGKEMEIEALTMVRVEFVPCLDTPYHVDIDLCPGDYEHFTTILKPWFAGQDFPKLKKTK